MQPQTDPRNPTGIRFREASLTGIQIAPEFHVAILEWFKKGKGFLVFLGSVGTGKTYFCSALINYNIKTPRFDTVRYWDEKSLLGRVRSSMDQGGDYIETLNYLCDYELLILDDVGATGINEWRKEMLLSVLDQRYRIQRPAVFTSNLTPNDFLSLYGDRIHSRLFATENTLIEAWTGDLRQKGL